MKSMTQNQYTQQQIDAWLSGLLSVAWADGDFGEQEQAIISSSIGKSKSSIQNSISPKQLRAGLGDDPNLAEQFIRTAVMVAIADGIYSVQEFKLIHEFSEALDLKVEALSSLEETLCKPHPDDPNGELVNGVVDHSLLNPVKEWLDQVEVKDPRLARFLCKMIPAQCPFERDVTLFGHKIVHIPPMCKLNPLYDQLVGLRFRSLSYLADECHEDITEYIQ
ncbi:MAG: Mo-dependent nitrogenase C-terminal domain-containing protein [Cyanobacteriota bacterium ELA615]